MATCLERAGLTAGLADFWFARETNAASDWRIQVQTIDGVGEARVWGNDRMWYSEDIHDPARRPDYRFIVMDRLPADRMLAVYGAPDRVMVCATSDVWVYDDSRRLFHGLRAASPFLEDQFAAGPPR